MLKLLFPRESSKNIINKTFGRRLIENNEKSPHNTFVIVLQIKIDV